MGIGGGAIVGDGIAEKTGRQRCGRSLVSFRGPRAGWACVAELLMTRPEIPDFIRLTIVATGLCSLIVAAAALGRWRGWQRTEGTVEILQVVEYERTNLQTQVAYTRANGVQTHVFSTDGIPARVSEGEHLPVLYDPRYGKRAVVYTFYTVWGIPITATALGVLLTLFGLFARSRRRVALD